MSAGITTAPISGVVGAATGVSGSDSISVAVRVRPAKSDVDLVEWVVQDNIIYAAQPDCQHNVFAFDHIFSQEKTNADIYEEVVGPIIDSVLDGYHGTVFAYGQTSSGKTHTMMGNDADPGIIKRAIAYIFEQIHKAADREFMIRISYLEIYNEQIRDLLNPHSSALQIKGPDMAVSGLTEQVCTDADELLHWMLAGDKNRQVGCTNMNERSSRSHSIFRVTLESSHRNADTNKREGVTVSQLNLVDLAGSERATQTGATGTRLREGCHINTSLTALGIVIRKLSKGEKHINFRDSKLTRILQNSLGGNSRTAVVCTIAPFDYETSLSTLRFGSEAKRIRNRPVINQVLSEDASLLQKRNKEIESLKALIHKVESGKEQQLKEKDQTITQLQKKIAGLQKLAIGGDLPANVTERRGSMVSSVNPVRADSRRRETWCAGQVAAATPGKKLAAGSAISMLLEQHPASGASSDDSFIAQYGTYVDEKDNFGAFCTPARPRKRKSFETESTTSSTSTETLKNSLLQPDCNKHADSEEIAKLKGMYEDAMDELRELREHLAFLQNEQKVCCHGTPAQAAKRPRIGTPEGSAPEGPDFATEQTCTPNGAISSVEIDRNQGAVTPLPMGLSLIQEEGSELEEESPFARKLKLMATPRHMISNMKRENALLKRSLMAFSGCSSPSETATTVKTLSAPLLRSPSPGLETADVSCQCDEAAESNFIAKVSVQEPMETESSMTTSSERPYQMVDRATSPVHLLQSPTMDGVPVRSTPRRSVVCGSLISFSTPPIGGLQAGSQLVQASHESWLDVERTPINLPIVLRDMTTQTDEPDEDTTAETAPTKFVDISIMTEQPPVKVDAHTSAISFCEDATGWPDTSDKAIQLEVVTVDVMAQTDLEPAPFFIPEQAAKWDTACQHNQEVLVDMEAQCGVETCDVNTSTLAPALTLDATSQTEAVTESPTSCGLPEGMNILLRRDSSRTATASAERSEPGEVMEKAKAAVRDVGVQARIEELWVIRMKLDKERTAREEAEKRLDDLWRENSRLVRTNDKYLAFLRQSGVDPKKILSGEEIARPLKETSHTGRVVSTPALNDQYRQKYETIKEFCWRHPDIKERLLSERVVLARAKVAHTPDSNAHGTTAERADAGRTTPDECNEAESRRPLAELQDVQEFRGVDYLSKADPGECRPS
ncbi:hypothetical protein BIW11_12722 [Tropilaelaps mercedesae]|uniref:Kinesin motor domain-containing protein n=1 Tax=Tropilaelaps mercedesae TaxID=418985 RepID=A0A1V9X5M8_9ACAR|nr:hypothetical protein BIW11_12722 [Tropilaelaps mercedesae]